MAEPWYAKGLAFECTQCGNCCSGPSQGYVWVTDQDIEHMASIMEMRESLDAFRDRFVRQVGLRQSLVEYADGDCIFLDPHTRTCLVYAARPIQCRTWPFWDSNLESTESWRQAASNCPGCDRGPVYSLDSIDRVRSQKTGPNL